MNACINFIRNAWPAGLCALLLAGCGGGGNGGSVTSLQASPLAYSRATTVSVSGAGLDRDDITLVAQGPCSNITRIGNPAATQAQFSCLVDGTGPIVFRLLQGGSSELGRLTVEVPLPQVTMQVRQAERTGTFVLELDPRAAPVTVRNFISYVNLGFYADTLFHRVLPGKLAQGGGYLAGLEEKEPDLPSIVLESDNGLKNLRGTIGMARTLAPDSATSQFYINLSDNPEFDRIDFARPGYAVFGRVVSGLNVVDEIGAVTTINFTSSLGQLFEGLPVTDVVITAALQTR